MGQMIELKRADGVALPAYEARAGDDKPGVVVVQEWWGLNEQIKSVTDRVAEAGFNAVVPDLYRGKLTQDMDEASHYMGNLDFPAAVKDIGACLDHLRSGGHEAGVMGFCMGGALTIMSSVHLEQCGAGVCFYGIPSLTTADPKDIRCRLQLHFADKDDWCTPNAVDALEVVLQDANISHQLYRYDAQHGFVNAARPEVYDARQTELAWGRAMSFLFGALS